MIWIRAAIWTRAELIFTSIGLQTPARPLMKYRVTRYSTFKWESVHGTRNYGCKQYNGTILEATVNASSRIDVTTSSLPLFYSVITGQNKVRSGPSETWENAFYLSRSEKKIQKVFSFLIKQDKTTSLYFTVCCATKKRPSNDNKSTKPEEEAEVLLTVHTAPRLCVVDFQQHQGYFYFQDTGQTRDFDEDQQRHLANN